MNPALGSVPAVDVEVRIDRKLVVPGQVWAADRPRALVAIVHGLGEHSGRYAALGSALAEAGYTTVALDLPGHGDAPGPRGDVGDWAQVRDAVVPAMFTAANGMPGQPAGLPIVLFGHSLGGLLALDVLLARPRALAAAVISAPALRTDPPPMWKRALARVVGAVAPAAGFPNGLSPRDLARDDEVVTAYVDDPRVHRVASPRLYFQILEARARVMSQAAQLAVPTLLLQGMEDKVVDPRGALEFVAAAASAPVQLVTLPGTYHELFNDIGREAVLQQVVTWLDGRFPA